MTRSSEFSTTWVDEIFPYVWKHFVDSADGAGNFWEPSEDIIVIVDGIGNFFFETFEKRSSLDIYKEEEFIREEEKFSAPLMTSLT